MKNQIKVALIVRGSKERDSVVSELSATEIQLTVFASAKELGNTGFFDVLIVHETFLPGFDRKAYKESEVIVLTDSQNRVAELYPKLQDLNIFTVLIWPVAANDLAKYIRLAYEGLITKKKTSAAQDESGKSIVITSFANGAGKTLIAYNLAAKLAQFFQAEMVSLVDMNVPFSNARPMLNLNDNYNWHSIRPILQEGIASRQKIQNVIYPTKYNFSLMSGPSDFASNVPLAKKEFLNLQESLTKLFKATIIDWHTVSSKPDFEYLSKADLVLVIVDMTSNGIVQTMRALAYKRDNEPELLQKVRFVFNGIDGKNGKTPELVESKLEIQPFALIDEDHDAVNAILENGELFNDKSLLIDAQIYSLAEKIVKTVY